MRILSWNVNGLGARIDAVRRLAAELCPDVMCFQKERGGAALHEVEGYMGMFDIFDTMDGPQPLFGGVSTFVRQRPGIEMWRLFRPIRGWIGDTGNVHMMDWEDFFLVNAYVPYSNAADRKWLDTRRRWDYEFHDLIVRMSELKPVVICGDLNIVAQDIDAWDGVSVKDAGCFYPWEHRNFDAMLRAGGLVDSYRMLHPDGRDYSYFYQNRPEYRRDNQGFRIDYFLVSGELMPAVRRSEILTDIHDTTNSPILLDIDI